MKVLLAAMWLVACDRSSDRQPAVAPPAVAPPTVVAPVPQPAPPFACGELTCTGDQICVEVERAGGVAPPPGRPGGAALHYRCAPAAATPGADCTPVVDRRQRCFEKIPVAPRR